MIKANVYNRKLMVENFTVSDSVRFDTVSFTFPETWEGYTKTAVFKTESGQTINVILDKTNPLCIDGNECYIPHEVLKAPHFYLSVFGVLGESVATTTQETVKVLQSGYAEGDEPSEPTPTEYQQIIKLVDQTKSIAQSVRADADNGAFNGEKGEKGDKGDKGDQGIQGIQGEKGEPGDITEEYARRIFAPVIRNSASGKILSIKDVSQEYPNLDIRLVAHNLIQQPYYSVQQTVDGITFAVYADGGLGVNGICNGQASFIFASQLMLSAGTYTYKFTDTPQDGIKGYITTGEQEYRSEDSICFTVENDTAVDIGVLVENGTELQNLVIEPKLVLSDFSSVTLKKLGKNLATAEQVYEGCDLYQVVEYDGRQCVRFLDNKTIQWQGIKFKENTQYTVSFDARVVKREAKEGNSGLLYFYYSDGTSSCITASRNSVWTHYTQASTKGKTVVSIGTGNYNYVNYNYIDTASFQLEEGSVATEYEAYAGQDFTPSIEGKIEIIEPLSTNTIFMTDTANIDINATYNADTKLYIDSKLNQ